MKRVIQVTCKMLRKARFTMATWSGALVLAGLLTGGVPDASAQTCIDDVVPANQVPNNCTANDVNLGLLVVVQETDGCSFIGDTATITLSRITLVNETPTGTNAKIRGQYLRNGTTAHWTTWEEDFGSADYVANRFALLNGMQATQLVYSFDHPGKQMLKLAYEGKTRTNAAATASSGAYTAFAAQPIMNSAEHWSAAFEGAASLAAKVKSMNLTIDSPRNLIDGAGSLGPDDSDMNAFSMKLQVSLFGSEAAAVIEKKHLDFVSSSWDWKTLDANNAGYHWYLPQLRHDEGVRKAGPKDSRVMIPMGAKVSRDTVEGFMFQICKLPATA